MRHWIIPTSTSTTNTISTTTILRGTDGNRIPIPIITRRNSTTMIISRTSITGMSIDRGIQLISSSWNIRCAKRSPQRQIVGNLEHTARYQRQPASR
jgi:hypothetical protein